MEVKTSDEHPKQLNCVACGARTVSTVGKQVDGKWYCYNCAPTRTAVVSNRNISSKDEVEARARLKCFSKESLIDLCISKDREIARLQHETRPSQTYMVTGRFLPLSENGVLQVGLGNVIHEATHEVIIIDADSKEAGGSPK